jgi:hypothetical protein
MKKPSLAFHWRVNQGGHQIQYQGRQISERSPWLERNLQNRPLQPKINFCADKITTVPFRPDPFLLHAPDLRWPVFTCKLTVKNPSGGNAIAHRSLPDIMDILAALDDQGAEVLANNRGLL